jgi:heat shock protein HtpX
MNGLKTTMLLAALTALVVGIAYMMGGEEYGNQYAVIALVFAGVMNFIMFWFSDKMVLAMYKAKRVEHADSPQLYGIVERLAQKARMPMPKVYIIDTETPNAFATGRGPSHASVAATVGILRLLSEAELEGVMAHELSHVKNRDTLISTLAATLGGAVTMLARMALYSRGRRDNKLQAIGMIAMVILAPIVAAMIQMAVSRSREYVADEDGAYMCGNPGALASALSRLQSGVKAAPMDMGTPATSHLFIINPFKADVIAKLFSTHPPTEERVKRLKAMRM